MSERFSGENNPAKRPEVREKISKKKKNQVVPLEVRKKISKTVLKLWEDQEYIDKHCGENHPQWIGGLSEYPREWNEKLKEVIRWRDGHICQLCFNQQEDVDTKFDVHHIDYDKKNCDLDNLISLCKRCHRRTNTKQDREQWQSIFASQ